MELGLDLKLRSWSWNWRWNWSWSWYSGDLPELELELELKPPELELELIFWRFAGVGVGVGVETPGVGVGVGVGVDILEIGRSWSWSWVDIMELTRTLIETEFCLPENSLDLPGWRLAPRPTRRTSRRSLPLEVSTPGDAARGLSWRNLGSWSRVLFVAPHGPVRAKLGPSVTRSCWSVGCLQWSPVSLQLERNAHNVCIYVWEISSPKMSIFSKVSSEKAS